MHGVGPGSLLGGRYVAHRRLSVDGRSERWSATDTVLEREVALVCLPASLPQAPAVLDAARRASALEDPRLVGILDVGADGGLRYVVEQSGDGIPLADLLTEGALPADEVRRIVGEVSVVLERARLLGLHHQVLTPRNVLRSPAGRVTVRGLAIEAALFELEEPDSALASRRDAEALVALAYAALTTRWPIRTPFGYPEPGLDPAPRIVGGVAAPSELAAGVPADLDLIARLTLREGAGPTTPGDLANQIAPWPEQPVDLVHSPRPRPRFGMSPPTVTLTDLPLVPAPTGGSASGDGWSDPLVGAAPPFAAPPIADGGDAAEAAAEGQPAEQQADDLGSSSDAAAEADESLGSDRLQGSDSSQGSDGSDGPEDPPASGPDEAAGANGARDTEGQAIASERGRPEAARELAPSSQDAGQGDLPGAATTVLPDGASASDPDGASAPDPDGAGSTDDDVEDDRPPITTREALATGWAATRRGAGSAAAATAAARDRALAAWRARHDRKAGQPGSVWEDGSAGAFPPGPAGSPGGPDPTPSRSGSTPPALGSRLAIPPGLKSSRPVEATRRVVDKVAATLSTPGDPTNDSPAPFLPPTAHTPHRDQSRQAIAILAALVIVAFVIAWFNLPPIFGGSSDGSPRPRPTTTTKPVASTTTSVGPAPVALAIKAVTSYDPEGDGQEGDNRLARAWDKDPATFWYSSTYVSSSWSGLKSGVGLILDLGAAHKVKAVTVTMHGRQSLQVLAGNDRAKSGATLLGAISGDGALTVTAATPVTARYVVLWITNPANVGSGQYRAEVSEVAVLGAP